MLKMAIKKLRKYALALLVAYMLALHNVYNQKADTPDSIKNKIEWVSKTDHESD
jgi:hypothetical protein